MLKILFGRYSRFVRTVEAVAVILAGMIVYQLVYKARWSVPDYLFVLLLGHYLFIRFCDVFPWYPGVKSRDPRVPELGIEIHFLKALVPTSYILFATALLYLLGLEWFVTIAANLMMIAVSGVNGILITFHIRDRDPLPVNYFTRELIVSGEQPIVAPAGKGERSAA